MPINQERIIPNRGDREVVPLSLSPHAYLGIVSSLYPFLEVNVDKEPDGLVGTLLEDCWSQTLVCPSKPWEDGRKCS